MKEAILTEDDLRNLLDKAPHDRMREGLRMLLDQIQEARDKGWNPVCVLKENGEAFLFDATEHMGT